MPSNNFCNQAQEQKLSEQFVEFIDLTDENLEEINLPGFGRIQGGYGSCEYGSCGYGSCEYRRSCEYGSCEYHRSCEYGSCEYGSCEYRRSC